MRLVNALGNLILNAVFSISLEDLHFISRFGFGQFSLAFTFLSNSLDFFSRSVCAFGFHVRVGFSTNFFFHTRVKGFTHVECKLVFAFGRLFALKLHIFMEQRQTLTS